MPSSIYVCQQCGKTYPKWQGKCDECDAWSSLSQEVSVTRSGSKHSILNIVSTTLSAVKREKVTRMPTGIPDFD